MVKDYYRLDEAAHRLECKVTDFLHLAATAKIVLSVFVDEEYIHSVFNADDEADYSRHYAPWKGEGVPDFCKPVYPNLFDLSQQSAVELENTGTATVSKLSCKEGSIITVLHKPAWFYGGFPKQDIKITAKELEKAKGLIQSEVPEAEQPKEVDAREDSKHTSVVDYCCDLLLWDFERYLRDKATDKKVGEGEPLLWNDSG